jgi:DNA-binding response OmpR family regulator
LEDDDDQAQLLALWLEDAGHQCRRFATGRAFIKALITDSYDLSVLDWMLPDMSGIEVLEWIRSSVDWPMPVLFVTRMDREEDIVRALGKGADDYMAKPVKRREMLARIAALMRRSQKYEDAQSVVEFEPYKFDRKTRVVTRGEQVVPLTQKEFDLALFLFRNAGRLLSRGHMLEQVWGRNPDMNTRTVDTHVSRLRNKLGISAEVGWRLSSIYQHGYRLEHLGSL